MDKQTRRSCFSPKYAYDWAIDKGIAKEQAPKCQRRSNKNYTIYEWHIKKLGTLHRIRGANGTQKEHMEIVHACAEVIAEISFKIL